MGSTLNRTGESRPGAVKGHSTRELGPSDSSDTGSDVVGGPGLTDAEGLPLDTGTSGDVVRGAGAGRDLGDTDLDSDSDSAGTGERGAAGRDAPGFDADRSPDRIEQSTSTEGDISVESSGIDTIDSEAPDDDDDDGVASPRAQDDESGDEDIPSPRRH